MLDTEEQVPADAEENTFDLLYIMRWKYKTYVEPTIKREKGNLAAVNNMDVYG